MQLIFKPTEGQIYRSLTQLNPNSDDVAALALSTGANLLLYVQGQAKSYKLPIAGCTAPPAIQVAPCPAPGPPAFLTAVAGGSLYLLTDNGSIQTADGAGSLVHCLTVNLESQVIAGSPTAIYVAVSGQAFGRSAYALMRYDLSGKQFRSVYGPSLEPVTAVIVMQ